MIGVRVERPAVVPTAVAAEVPVVPAAVPVAVEVAPAVPPTPVAVPAPPPAPPIAVAIPTPPAVAVEVPAVAPPPVAVAPPVPVYPVAKPVPPVAVAPPAVPLRPPYEILTILQALASGQTLDQAIFEPKVGAYPSPQPLHIMLMMPFPQLYEMKQISIFPLLITSVKFKPTGKEYLYTGSLLPLTIVTEVVK